MSDNQHQNPQHAAPTTPMPQPAPQPQASNSGIKEVERATVWVMVLSAITFGAICILAIWGVLGVDSGDVIGKSLGTLAVIAFAALIVNLGANMLEGKKK